MLTVVPFGIETAPLPPSVPPVQLIEAEVTLIAAVPLSTPPCIASVGTVSGVALLRVSVPPLTRMLPVLVMLLSVAVAPVHLVRPLMPYDAPTVLVPPFQTTVPAP